MEYIYDIYIIFFNIIKLYQIVKCVLIVCF